MLELLVTRNRLRYGVRARQERVLAAHRGRGFPSRDRAFSTATSWRGLRANPPSGRLSASAWTYLAEAEGQAWRAPGNAVCGFPPDCRAGVDPATHRARLSPAVAVAAFLQAPEPVGEVLRAMPSESMKPPRPLTRLPRSRCSRWQPGRRKAAQCICNSGETAVVTWVFESPVAAPPLPERAGPSRVPAPAGTGVFAAINAWCDRWLADDDGIPWSGSTPPAATTARPKSSALPAANRFTTKTSGCAPDPATRPGSSTLPPCKHTSPRTGTSNTSAPSERGAPQAGRDLARGVDDDRCAPTPFSALTATAAMVGGERGASLPAAGHTSPKARHGRGLLRSLALLEFLRSEIVYLPRCGP